MIARNQKMENELRLAYRHAVKSGSVSFHVAFKDGEKFEIKCEKDVTKWIEMYYEKEKEKQEKMIEIIDDDEFKDCKECQC